VRCDSGEALTVHGVNGTENAPLAAGAPVWAGWEPAAGLVLADDGTQIAS
jgi:hypothetical protein